jgi:hypothetical protein
MENELLRHTLLTIQHRFQISVDQLDEEFKNFSAGNYSRTPLQLVQHINELLEVKCNQLMSENLIDATHRSEDFHLETKQTYRLLKKLDHQFLDQPINIAIQKKLIQGPLSDIFFTHIGQILLIRRLYGKPAKGGNYSSTDINSKI